MIALLLASQIAAVGGDPLIQTPAACRLAMTVARAAPGQVRAQRLIDLPKPHLEIAVDRRIGGCPAPLIVRYAVEGDGRAGVERSR